jgi:hypothetical protein
MCPKRQGGYQRRHPRDHFIIKLRLPQSTYLLPMAISHNPSHTAIWDKTGQPPCYLRKNYDIFAGRCLAKTEAGRDQPNRAWLTPDGRGVRITVEDGRFSLSGLPLTVGA